MHDVDRLVFGVEFFFDLPVDFAGLGVSSMSNVAGSGSSSGGAKAYSYSYSARSRLGLGLSSCARKISVPNVVLLGRSVFQRLPHSPGAYLRLPWLHLALE
jgi:hypothetical protein